MRLATPEFIRRFLIHVMADGFHRIRHYGMLASAAPKANISRIRALLCVQRPEQLAVPEPRTETAPLTLRKPCPWLAATRCASSRYSSAGKNRCHARHRGTRPHDISPVIHLGTPPAAIRTPGPDNVRPFISSAAQGGNNSETRRLVEITGRVCDHIRHLARHQPHPGCCRRPARPRTFPIA
jgi:hypothetical protein